MTGVSHTDYYYVLLEVYCSEEAITGNYVHTDQGCSPQIHGKYMNFFLPSLRTSRTKLGTAEYLGLTKNKNV